MTQRYHLPMAPTMNNYWRSLGRGRVIISAEGREYRKTVWGLIREAPQPKLTKRLVVTIAATFARNGRADLDNRLKPLLDALQHAGVYEDDSQIDDLRIYRAGVAKPGALLVTVTEVDPRAADEARAMCS